MKKLLFIVLALLLTGCTQKNKPPAETKITASDQQAIPDKISVRGQAVDGLIQGGSVSIHAVPTANTFGSCTPGKLLATSTTDENGSFKTSIPSYDQELLIFKVTGGSYYEEATNEKVLLRKDQVFYGISRFIKDSNGKANIRKTISGFSNAMYSLVCYQRANNAQLSWGNAYNSAFASITLLAGGIDVVNTEFKDIYSSAYANVEFGTNVNQFWFSLYNSGISHMVKKEAKRQGSALYSVNFWMELAKDIRHDGVINGIGIGGKEVKLGNKKLTPDFLRVMAMREVNSIVKSKSSRTAVKFNEVKSVADANYRVLVVHANKSDFLGGTSAAKLDNVPPSIFVGGIPHGSYLNTSITVTADEKLKSLTYDVFKNGVSVLISPVVLPTGSTEAIFTLINSVNIRTGAYKLRIKAIDKKDNVTITTRTVNVVKEAPALTLKTWQEFVTSTINFSGSYSLVSQDVDLDSITIKLVKSGGNLLRKLDVVLNKSFKTFSVNNNLGNVFLSAGDYNVNIKICDVIHNCSTLVKRLRIDTIKPTISDLQTNQSIPVIHYNPGTKIITPQEIVSVSQFSYSSFKSLVNNLRFDGIGFKIKDGKQSLKGETNLSFTNLQSKGFPLLLMYLNDNLSVDDLTVEVVYSTSPFVSSLEEPTEIIETIISTRSITITDNALTKIGNRYKLVLPITTEYLAPSFYREELETKHLIRIKVCDKVGLCKNHWFAFNYLVELKAPKVLSNPVNTGKLFTDKLHAVSIFQWRMPYEIESYTYKNENSVPVAFHIEANTSASVSKITDKAITKVWLFNHLKRTMFTYCREIKSGRGDKIRDDCERRIDKDEIVISELHLKPVDSHHRMFYIRNFGYLRDLKPNEVVPTTNFHYEPIYSSETTTVVFSNATLVAKINGVEKAPIFNSTKTLKVFEVKPGESINFVLKTRFAFFDFFDNSNATKGFGFIPSNTPYRRDTKYSYSSSSKVKYKIVHRSLATEKPLDESVRTWGTVTVKNIDRTESLTR